MQDLLPPPPLPGDQVGPWILGRPLGVGGMATVYEARGPEGGVVAIKILHPGRAGTQDERLFRREIQTLTSMDHPGVVRVLGAGREGPYPWMALEYVDGSDLEALLARWAEDPPPDRMARAEAIFRELCGALGAVHARGLLHRDLKPSNVLLTRDGHVKLADFGLVDAALGRDETLMGTPAFIAPERILGRPADSRSDLYALGAVLYALLTGRLPFAGEAAEVGSAPQLQGRARPPSELDPRVPPALEALCMRLLERDPAARPASARQALAELDRPLRAEIGTLRGREDVLARLLSQVEAARGAVVVLTGPSGSGRTTLLSALAREARRRGRDVALCVGEREDPLGALCEQLPDLGEALCPLPDPLSRLAWRARGRPWALLVDDLDRMEPAAQDAMTALARDRIAVEGEPLLVVVSVTDPEGPAAGLCTGLATGLEPELVRLEPLQEADVVALLRDLGLPGVSARALGRRLVQEGLSWPGAVAARIGALERVGALVRAETGTLLPARGQAWIDERPLPEGAPAPPWREGAAPRGTALAVAELLAALDGAAPMGLLVEVCGEPGERGARALEALGLAEIEPEEEDEGEQVRLLDPAEGEALLASLEPGFRRGTHASLAAALLRWAPRSGRWVPVIADQLQRAGQTAQCWPLLVEAARIELRRRRSTEAWRWLRRAMEVRGVAEQGLDHALREATRARMHATEAELWERQESWLPAAESWARAAQAEGLAEDELMRARCGQGRALVALERLEEGRALLAEALVALAPGEAAWLPSVRALAHAAQTCGRAAEAAQAWRAILGFARAIGLEEEAIAAQRALDGLETVARETAAADH